QALEQRLIAQLHAQQQIAPPKETFDIHIPSGMPYARPAFRTQSTWVASFVMLMVAGIGVLLVSIYQNQTAPYRNETPAAATQPSQMVSTPDWYSTIGLPLKLDTLQGLTIGDRVDVLSYVDDEIRVVASNLLISDIQPEVVMFSAPLWQQGILTWLYQSKQSYAIRLYTGTPPALADETPVEFVFTSPEPLPEGYEFDLIVNVPASQSYLLTELPVSIDHIPFTFNGNTLRFWFKDIEVLSIERTRTVTVQMPRGDAANLEHLMGLGMDLSFIPDEDRSR
ncbi:MAG: hypothetical protein MUF38_17585, partial [Anaerolineae bacterium]|nr:hypothetical protein [Anaerolineae bacterium]